jgi:hypothetical protein
MHNKKLIEAVSITFDVETLFVWQPVPTYKLDQQQHLFASDDSGNHTYSKYGYIRMAEYIETNPQGKNFLWAADMHQGKKGPYYVDAVHYSAGFSKDIAATIGDMLVKEYPLLADQRE